MFVITIYQCRNKAPNTKAIRTDHCRITIVYNDIGNARTLFCTRRVFSILANSDVLGWGIFENYDTQCQTSEQPTIDANIYWDDANFVIW
ncbi:hypothetical protein MH1LPH_17850 [Lactiplantibacillus brownii]